MATFFEKKLKKYENLLIFREEFENLTKIIAS